MAVDIRSVVGRGSERASTLDVIGRYEARLSRQLLKYLEEFERLQTVRKDQDSAIGTNQPKRLKKTSRTGVSPLCGQRIGSTPLRSAHPPTPTES